MLAGDRAHMQPLRQSAHGAVLVEHQLADHGQVQARFVAVLRGYRFTAATALRLGRARWMPLGPGCG